MDDPFHDGESNLEKDVLEKNNDSWGYAPPGGRANTGRSELEREVMGRGGMDEPNTDGGLMGASDPTAPTPSDVSFLDTPDSGEPDIDVTEDAAMAYDQLRSDMSTVAGAAKTGYSTGRRVGARAGSHAQQGVSKLRQGVTKAKARIGKYTEISRDDGGDVS